MIKKITIIAGLLLGAVGSLGLVAPTLLSLNSSPSQSALYLLSGATALYFGLTVSPAPARTFCILLGSFYAFLGLAGVGLGGPHQTFTIVPGQLVFQTMDHVFHLILGAIVLAAGLSGRVALPVLRGFQTSKPSQHQLISDTKENNTSKRMTQLWINKD